MENNLAPLSCGRISSRVWVVRCSLKIAALRPFESKHSRSLPFGFLQYTNEFTQAVGSPCCILAIIPLVIILLYTIVDHSFFTSSFRLNGTLRGGWTTGGTDGSSVMW